MRLLLSAIVTAGSLILAIAAFAQYLPLLLFRSIRLLPLPWRAASGLRVKLLHRECEAKSKEIRCSFAGRRLTLTASNKQSIKRAAAHKGRIL